MERFKRILAEEVVGLFVKQGEDVSADEIIEDMGEALPELEALYKAAQRYSDEQNKNLSAYMTQTVGLWATDRPDSLTDHNGLLFQLKYEG